MDRDRDGDRVPIPDGGTEDATGADDVALDPWGSATVSDYRKLFDEFGIERFEAVLPEVPDPHHLMRRGVIFGHREYRPVARAMRDGEPFAALSGFMPTGDPHIGHKLVFDEIIWHQERGGDAYALIADLEAHAARGLPWDEIDEHATDYLLSLLALGFDPDAGEIYRQSTNRTVQDLAFELGIETNASELGAIYGFDGETEISHMQSVATQMADILYPQLDEPKPTVIPVGPDQDPHVRLARDLATRMRLFKITAAYASFEADDAERALIARAHGALSTDDGATRGDDDANADDPVVRCRDAAAWLRERSLGADDARASAIEKLAAAGAEPVRPRTRIFAREVDDESFSALVEAVPGEKRVYDAHVDAFEIDRDRAAAIAREVERSVGGYAFRPPSSIYHRFMTGLTGGKMSSSVPASHISLLDDPDDAYEKVRSAITGGRESAEKQRELGGEADECPVYELYAYLLTGDDDEFAERVYEECVGGDRLCGDCKEQAAELMREFLADHQEKRDAMRSVLDDLDVNLSVAARR
ncbi:tryptophan--tRNA ligase [Halobacteriales archaeon SW_7_68_16]|nr:MAG: tryptophan--tRNA ligase [Halobacteriales archaeon SW_7_68_16]